MPVLEWRRPENRALHNESVAGLLADLPEDERAEFLGSLSDEEALRAMFTWELWARPNQLEPERCDCKEGIHSGVWRTWLIMAGRGFGKTRTGAEWIRKRQESGKFGRFALIGRSAADVRDVMVEGESGILNISPPWNRPIYQSSRRRVEWPNGAYAILFSADEPDQLRGPQHDSAWCISKGSLVETESGRVPIESIRVGDLVHTRKGLRRVTASTITKRKADVLSVRTDEGHELVATPNHKIWTTNRGWVTCKDLQLGDTLLTWKHLTQAHQLGLIGTIFDGTATNSGTTRTAPADSCISPFGSIPRALAYRKGTSSTIGTKTPRTTNQKILSLCRDQNIRPSTYEGEVLNTPGTNDLSVVAKFCPIYGQNDNQNNAYASSAPTPTPLVVHILDSATPTAKQHSTVISVEPASPVDVYDLTIDGAHEFFASGVLVHNCDEIASWRYPEAWDQLQFGLRLGVDPRTIATTTPRPTKFIREIASSPFTHITPGATLDNLQNLAPAFIDQIIKKYQGTRLGRQELEGILLDDIEGALWVPSMFEERKAPNLESLKRIVVALDPSVKEDGKGAEAGIIVAGIDHAGIGYILGDRTTKSSPKGWAEAAIAAFDEFRADRVVAEINNGGAIVEALLRTIRENIPYLPVHASRGKQPRAEPIVSLYEQKRVFHAMEFPALEEQLTTWTPSDKDSPDRLDALVWALTDLMITPAEPTELKGVGFASAKGWFQRTNPPIRAAR